ncbi:MAG: hypothetical protein ABR608_16330 [Pseudonocardiaceae bacterium]
MSLLTGQVGLDGGAQHLADRPDLVLGQNVDQTVHLVPGGHANSVPRPPTWPLTSQHTVDTP